MAPNGIGTCESLRSCLRFSYVTLASSTYAVSTHTHTPCGTQRVSFSSRTKLNRQIPAEQVK